MVSSPAPVALVSAFAIADSFSAKRRVNSSPTCERPKLKPTHHRGETAIVFGNHEHPCAGAIPVDRKPSDAGTKRIPICTSSFRPQAVYLDSTGNRIPRRFAIRVFDRKFNPHRVLFTEEMLKPELQRGSRSAMRANGAGVFDKGLSHSSFGTQRHLSIPLPFISLPITGRCSLLDVGCLAF